MYWKYLKERIDEGELDTLVNERNLNYELEEGEEELGPKVELEE